MLQLLVLLWEAFRDVRDWLAAKPQSAAPESEKTPPAPPHP